MVFWRPRPGARWAEAVISEFLYESNKNLGNDPVSNLHLLSHTGCSHSVAVVVTSLAEISSRQRTIYLQWLDGEELSRYQGFRNRISADCFLLARAIVKHTLAGYLQLSPNEVSITLSAQGKPALLQQSSYLPAIHFSISHKLNRVMVGFSSELVGIDFETLIRMDKMGIARRFFLSEESDRLQALDADARNDLFTKIWALKEAEVKRQGRTLAEMLGTVGFVIDGRNIQCHGLQEPAQFQLFQLADRVDDKARDSKDSKHKERDMRKNQAGIAGGYLALASSSSSSSPPMCFQGLPLAGYEKVDLIPLASSGAAKPSLAG